MSTAARTFAPETASVPAARRFVAQTLRGWQLPGAAEAAELLVCEIATNAVLHARTAFSVEVVRGDFGDGNVVRVRVSDASSTLPRRRSYQADATTGRGIRLVHTLSSRWSVERIEHAPGGRPGKVVSFDVPATGDAGRSFTEREGAVDELLAQYGDLDDVQEPSTGSDRPGPSESALRQHRQVT